MYQYQVLLTATDADTLMLTEQELAMVHWYTVYYSFTMKWLSGTTKHR